VTQSEWRQRWQNAERYLEQYAAAVDRLNVFPVADRDTGHNMLATLHAGVAALTDEPSSPRAAARALVEGAVRLARGNSGVILSQWLKGFVEAAPDEGDWSWEHFRTALAVGARQAREQVAEPVEGTILTVADAAASAASGGTEGAHFWPTVLDAAGSALARTPDALSVLREAGVVDAGGQGLLLILQGLSGGPARPPSADPSPRLAQPVPEPIALTRPYEVEAFLLDPAYGPDRLKSALSRCGDSVVVAFSDDRAIRIHVHTDRPHEVVGLLTSAGRLRELKVLNMQAALDDDPMRDGEGPWAVVEAEWASLVRAAGFVPLAPSDAADRPGALWLQARRVLRHAVSVPSLGALLVALDHWWDVRDGTPPTRMLERAGRARQFVVERRQDGYRRADDPRLAGDRGTVLDGIVRGLAGGTEGLLHVYIHAAAAEEEVRQWEKALGAEARRVTDLPVWVLIVQE
jgi:hypothetical protein